MALQLPPNTSLTRKLVSAVVTVIVLLLVGTAHPTKAATIVVPIGGNLQAAANAAQCGDTIVVQAGARFVTPGLEIPALILNSKPCTDTSWITIQSENAASLPATFKNLTPDQLRALNLPKLISDTATPALEAVAGSHHYRVLGFEIANDSLNRTRVNNALIMAGIRHGSSPSLTLATVPNQIEFDRVWVHGEEDGTDSEIATCLRGFMLGARNITIKNSRVAGFRAFAPGQPDYGQSTQAILIEKGPGPYTIHNNYLEAWFTSIFTGGGPQWISNQATVSNASMSSATMSNVANLKVGDYVAFKVTGQGSKYQVAKVTGISGNVVTYVPQGGLQNGDNPSEVTGNPLRAVPDMPGDAVWNGDTPKNLRITNNTFYKNPVVGTKVALSGLYGKGHIEFKTVTDGLVEGNEFSGYAAGFTITSRNQSDEFTSGNNPWATITNLTFRNNVWRGIFRQGSGALIGIQLNDNMNTTVQGRNVVFENMLFENLWSPLLHIGGSADVTFRNVTAVGGTPLGEVSMILGHSGANEGFRLENNILQNNEYGVNCPLGSTAACYPNYVVNGNVILDNRTPAKKIASGPLSNTYPLGNFYPATIAQIQFVDTLSSQWGLAATSPYKGLGNNGSDPGVDMARLLSALGGTLQPPPPTPTPTPVPTPTPTPVPTPTPTPVPTPTPTPVPTPTPTPVPTPTPTPVPTPTPTPVPTPTPTPSPTPPPPPSANASFVGLDTTTKGNWKNVYGSQGYNTINDAMSYPSYAQITVSGYTSPYWDDSTTDVRALQKAVGTDRVAARWSANSSFTIDLNMTDGQPHRVALYSLDWDGNNRSQRIDIVDWATGALLDTRQISSFNGGQYLVWDIRGRVRLVVTRTGAKTAVLSGLYFGAAGSAPTPTPTPIPTPSPSPTPTPNQGNNNPPYVSVISPSVNSVFGTGSNVTIQSSAGDSDGSISRVDFYRSGSLIGTATSSPYNCVWANVPSGNYSLTAVATDNLGARATSSPVAVSIKNSPASVNKARGRGNNLLTSLGSTTTYGGGEESYAAAALEGDLILLTNDVQTAYTDFVAERSTFGSTADYINTQLSAALYLSKSDAALAAKVGSSTSVRNHLLRLVAHLAVSEDLMLYGSITPTTQAQAAAATARLDLVIGPAHPSYTLNGAAQFAPLSLGSAFADAAIAPLTSQTIFANIGTDGSVPYELGGVNVTVGGKAVPVLYVSPSRISFHVTGDVPLGPVDVIVTSQNGLVSRGVTNIAPNLIQFMTKTDDPYGAGLAVNENKQTPEIFDVITTENFGPDKRTRVTVFATGLSGSANNLDPSNDVVVGGVVRKNFAESITVIARLNDGSLITLPVEFAGTQGKLPGLDQVNFLLTQELAGAGPIEMTIFVNGQRSNAPKIVVR